MYLVYTQIHVQMCRTEFMWLHSVMMTLNYCTSRIASSCQGTEPAGLLKYLQNRSRVYLAEAVTELRILGFFYWLPLLASRLPQQFDIRSCKPTTSMIILCSTAWLVVSRPRTPGLHSYKYVALRMRIPVLIRVLAVLQLGKCLCDWMYGFNDHGPWSFTVKVSRQVECDGFVFIL
jgi:hypothetical protein